MTIQPLDVLEMTARTEFNGVEDVANVYQMEYQGGAAITDAQGITDVISFLEALYAIFIGAQTILQLYRDIRVGNKTQGTVFGRFPWPTLVGGGDVAFSTAPGTAILSSFSTGIPRVTPRKYWGVFCADNMDADGTWGGIITATLAAATAFMLTPYVGVSGTWLYGYLSPKTLSFVVPNGSSTGDIPAYQRRRKQGKGS